MICFDNYRSVANDRPFLFPLAVVLRTLHFRLLKYHFDPVQHETPLPSNRHFLLPMTLIIIAQLYGIYGLDPNFKWSDIIDRSFYNSNPYIHYHQIVPRRSRRILQFLYFVTNASNIAILGCLALSSSTQINQKYRITLIDDDEKGEDHDADSAEIVRFQKKAKKVLLFNSVFYYLYYLIFTNRNVYLNGAFYWGFRHGLFWFLVIPIWTVYYIFITDALPINAIITVSIFRLKLQFLKVWWALYLRLNRRLLFLSRQLSAFSAFWNQPMTITFVVFILKSCYEVFVLMAYGRQMAPTQIAFFLVFPVYFFAMMILYVACCSSVVKQYALVRRETFRFAHLTSMDLSFELPLRQRLKTQWLSNQRRHLVYAFTLFGYYKISYNTFVELFSYISLLFLMMTERLSAEY
ncbi:hypothetical protein TYRP_019404 [Tyrophagus putrescentiae]|nr:hypothetical protein TYRP_019404 [Tyrophagus putrescentiae]